MGNIPGSMNSSPGTPTFECTPSEDFTIPSNQCNNPQTSTEVITVVEWEPTYELPKTPISSTFKPTIFPPVESRTPTKRFIFSKLEQKSPMSVSGRFPNKFQRDNDETRHVTDDLSSSEDEKDPSCTDNNTSSLSTSSSSSAATITDSATKRQKKRDKKKARQMNKENIIKKQKLQRAEAQRIQEEKTAATKKLLAMYAAAVAKPTVAKTMPTKAGAPLASASPQCTTASVSSASSTSSSSLAMQTRPPAKKVCPTSPVKSSEEVPPSNSTTPDSTGLEMQEISDEEQDSKKEEQEEPVEDQEEGVDCVDEAKIPEENEEFEVLVCGERRTVKPFTPRQHLNSSSVSGDDQDPIVEEASSTTSLETQERNTFLVPVRTISVGSNPTPSNPSIQVIPNQQAAQRFVTMPPAPIFMGQPMSSGYPPPQSFPNFQPGYAVPQFQPIQMMPMQTPIHNQPMGHVHMGMPMYVPQRPMHVPMSRPIMGPVPGPQMIMQPPPPVMPQMRMQPHTQLHITSTPQQAMQIQVQVQTHTRIPQDFSQPPPPIPSSSQRPMRPMAPPPQPQIQQQQPAITPPAPIRHVVHSQLYPGQRALSRPVRTPLAIVPPPPTAETLKLEPKAEKPKEVVKKEEPEKVGKSAVTKEVQESKEKNENQKIEDSKQEKPKVDAVQTSSPPTPSVLPDLNGELITAGVSVILDGPDDERLTPSNALPEAPSIALESEQDSINRVLGFTKNSGGEDFAIWTGLMSEMPPRPEMLKEESYEKMLELYQITAECEKKKTDEKTLMIVKKEPRLNLPAICKKMEPYFMNSRSLYVDTWVDSKKLRQMFQEAFGGDIPYVSWRVLQKVCYFEPGYLHVFDALIGSKLELTYSFKRVPATEVKDDTLQAVFASRPKLDADSVFFQRFSDNILQEVIVYLSGRLVSVRTFVAIIEVVKDEELTVSDLYYLSSLVWGSRTFCRKFNNTFTQLQIIETGGKRWIRTTPQQEASAANTTTQTGPRLSHEHRALNVPDFLTRLRPHIDDVLQLLPDTVIDDQEFFKAAKLVCGWRGDHEELVWKSIVRDREKYQEFYDSFRAFLRMEIRMGKLYLRKLAYGDEDYEEAEEVPDMVVSPHTASLTSAIRTKEKKEGKKAVSYAAEPTSALSSFTQTDNCDLDKIWDLERELIRQLSQNNTTFAEFIKSDDAREIFRYQFLADILRNIDLKYFAYILEKAVAEMREQTWTETVELRTAAEEARNELMTAREQHKKELDEFRERMETISRFETFEVEVELRSRINALRERIRELTEQKEVTVKEEVKEEKEAMYREKVAMIREHQKEKKLLQEEIARLKQENGRVLTEDDVAKELANIEKERFEMISRCEAEMNKSKKICEETSQLLRDSHCEIEMLRAENQRLTEQLNRQNERRFSQASRELLSSSLLTPEPEPMPDVSDAIHTAAFELSARAKLQLSAMDKMQAELKNEKFREIARKMLEVYCSMEGVNRKERKSAEKQLKEFEEKLDFIENAIIENIELLKLNVVEGLVDIPPFPMPFSDKIMKKMNENSDNLGVLFKLNENSLEDEEDCCLICYEMVTNGSPTLKCDTCFKEYHQPCISQWLTINSVCPACFRALKDPVEFPALG